MANTRTVIPPELIKATSLIETRRAEINRMADPTDLDRGELIGLTGALAMLMLATTTPVANGYPVG